MDTTRAHETEHASTMRESARTLLGSRHSCRAFLPDEVPPAVLASVFELAQCTASSCNTQPWAVVLTRAPATKRLSEALLEHVPGAPREPDYDEPEAYRGEYGDRRRAAGYALYESLGIAREDGIARGAQSLENFRFFGAPHVAVITTEPSLGVYGVLDCGGYIANLLTAASAHGLGAIPQAAVAYYPSVLRSQLPIPHDRRILVTVALGYPDQRHPANAFRTSRAGLSDVVRVVTERES